MVHDQHLDRIGTDWNKPKLMRARDNIRGRLLLSDCIDQILILTLLRSLLRVDGLQLLIGRDGLADLAQIEDRH